MSAADKGLIKDLALVLGMARSHVEDIESGLDEGLHEKKSTQELTEKNSAIARIQAMHDQLNSLEHPTHPDGRRFTRDRG